MKCRYPELPCVDLGKNCYQPMELCETTNAYKKLNEKEASDVIRMRTVDACSRKNNIEYWINSSEMKTDPLLHAYNIKVNFNLIELNGRVLKPPDLLFSNKCLKSQAIGNNGCWNHRGYALKKTVNINRWVCVRVSADVTNVADIIRKLKESSASHNIRISQDPVMIDFFEHDLDNTNPNRVLAQTDDLFERMRKKFNKNIDLIVVVFNGKSIVYRAIKTCGDLKYGIPTQGVDAKNLIASTFKHNQENIIAQSASNLLLKINSKLGGKNFVISQDNQMYSIQFSPYHGTLSSYDLTIY